MTLTIDVPDETVARFQAAAAARGQDVPTFLIDAANEVADAAEETEPDPELLEALREGFADIDAGRTLSLEEVDAHMEAALADARLRRAQQNGHVGAAAKTAKAA